MIGMDGVSSTQMGALARWFTAASSLRLSCSLRCADLIRGESTPLSILKSRDANCSADISRLNTATVALCLTAAFTARFNAKEVLCVGMHARPARYRWLGESTWMHRTGTDITRFTAVTKR